MKGMEGGWLEKGAVERGPCHRSSSNRPGKQCQYPPPHHSGSLRPSEVGGHGLTPNGPFTENKVAPSSVSKSPGSPRSSLDLGQAPPSPGGLGARAGPGMELPGRSSPTSDGCPLVSNHSGRCHHNPFPFALLPRGTHSAPAAGTIQTQPAGENVEKAPERPRGGRAAQSSPVPPLWSLSSARAGGCGGSLSPA